MGSVENSSRSNEKPKSSLGLIFVGLGMLFLMELVFWLDLLPILMLFWWQTLAVLAVVATLGLLFFLKRSADRKTQFSVRSVAAHDVLFCLAPWSPSDPIEH